MKHYEIRGELEFVSEDGSVVTLRPKDNSYILVSCDNDTEISINEFIDKDNGRKATIIDKVDDKPKIQPSDTKLWSMLATADIPSVFEIKLKNTYNIRDADGYTTGFFYVDSLINIEVMLFGFTVSQHGTKHVYGADVMQQISICEHTKENEVIEIFL